MLPFAPTKTAKQNLLKEGIPEGEIAVTGNTVIDALFDAYKIIDSDKNFQSKLLGNYNFLNTERKIILVTGHRRENFGHGFEEICKAIKEISKRDDVLVIYPVHLNPNVQKPVKEYLSNSRNIILLPPLDYPTFCTLCERVTLF